MSLISPLPQQTIIKMYKGIPWDAEYANIRLFDTAVQRETFLNNHIIGQWSNCSVVKLGSVIKLTGQINNVLTANYLSFVNTGIGSVGSERTFYAFITSVDYINNNTVQVTYSIDWIQTYLFDFEIGECMVEREHVNDDTFGRHVIDEGIAIGDYSIQQIFRHLYQKGYVCYYLSDVAADVKVNLKNGMLIATQFTANRELVRGDLELFLSQLNTVGESDKVVSLTMCPMPIGDQQDITDPDLTQTFNLVPDSLVFKDSSSTYTAQNNKMGVYPYKLFTVDNFNGSVQEFKWENFDGDPAFKMDGVIHPRPCLECYPTNYLKWDGQVFETRNFAVQYTNFPQIPWTSDTFRAWVSQNGTAMFWDSVGKGVQIAGGTIGAIASVASGNAIGAVGSVGAVVNAVGGLEQQQNSVEYHATHGSQLGGALEACGLDYLKGDIGFRVIEYCLKPEIAKRIDRFFTRYGYKVDEAKVPNIRGRQYCNYVKCTNAIVTGDIAVDAENAMLGALINGTTFWHTDNIGSAIVTNPITGGNT